MHIPRGYRARQDAAKKRLHRKLVPDAIRAARAALLPGASFHGKVQAEQPALQVEAPVAEVEAVVETPVQEVVAPVAEPADKPAVKHTKKKTK